MHRIASLWLAVLLLFALTLSGIAQTPAQTTAPKPAPSNSEELLGVWNYIGQKLVVMAEDFPEDKYDFKTTPAQRTFAENLLHIIGEDYRVLNAIKGSRLGPEEPTQKEYKTKADIAKLMKQVVADGATLLKNADDMFLVQEIKDPYDPSSMQHVWYEMVGAIEHSGEHYGQLVVYYRVAGLVPPDSRPKK
jgi:uncharacterized damage-inducible protein DinB